MQQSIPYPTARSDSLAGSRGSCRLSAALGLLLVSFASPAGADTPAPSEADREIAAILAEADAAFGAGNFLLALERMQAAYEVSPQPRLLANKALVLEKLGRFDEAVAAMKAFLGTEPDAGKRELAESFLGKVQPEVKLSSEPPGASVFLDAQKQPLGQTPIVTRLSIGKYTARLSLEGYLDASEQIVVEAGRPVSQIVTLKPEPGWGRAEWGWVVAGAGAAGAATGGVLLMLAHAEAGERDSATTLSAWYNHDNGAMDLERGSIVSFAVGGAALAVGVYLIATGGEDSPAPDRRPPVDAHLRPPPSTRAPPLSWSGTLAW